MIITTYRRTVTLLVVLLTAYTLQAQHRAKAQQIIADLCTDEMAGRGYINQGEQKAATYIAEHFKKIGLSSKTTNYLQPFSLDVNTITETKIVLDNKELVAGVDYLTAPNSGSANVAGKVFYVSQRMLSSTNVAQKVKRAVRKGYIPVISSYDPKDEIAASNAKEIRKCVDADMIWLKESLTWSVGREQAKNAEIWLLASAFDQMTKDISLEVKSELIKDYTTQNVYGYVPGTEYPDSVIIFCGHYDHLGKMGEAIFYGANDNASGISMLIDMAQYFVNNPQKYSVAFVAFGAEEAGLVGSLHYVKNPIVPLSKTKFVFNMDLMGSGEQGATIVNGSVFKSDFERLVNINTTNDYLPKIKSRGKAANSDHYFFSELGVPSFFIYLMGDYKHYHIPADNAANLKLGPYYDKSFLLIRDFICSFSK